MTTPTRATQPPRASVIVPLYQSARTIGATLDSLATQAVHGGLEILVINDGSTDNGPAIVESRARLDPRIRIISQPNQGLAAARNTGIQHARGDYLRFLDSDDLAEPGSTQRLIDAAESSGLKAACGPSRLIDDDGADLGRELPLPTSAPSPGPDSIGFEHFSSSNAVGVGAVLLHRNQLGPDRFDARYPGLEDWNLWLRLASRGVRLAALRNGPVKAYRVRRSSMSKDFAGMLAATVHMLRDAERLSKRERAEAERRYTLTYATMRALSDDSAGEAASAMFGAPPPGSARFTPDEAARAAFEGVLLGLGLRPERRAESRDLWCRRLGAWWERMAACGLLRRQDLDAAREHLAVFIVGPEQIARAMISACATDAPIVLVGLGTNGRVLARLIEERRIPYLALDDRPALSAAPISTKVPDHASVLITPLDDADILPRLNASTGLPQSPTLLRWSEFRSRLARDQHADLFPTTTPASTRSDSRPTVSTIVPLFNACATIKQTLRSLQNQSLTNWEALVIDDGSTDDGPAIVRELAAADTRIRIIHQPNQGLAAARNTGIDHARADFIHFLDADDAMTPDAFERLTAAAATGASCAAYELADADLRPIGREVPITVSSVGLDELLSHNRFVPHSTLLRRDLLGSIRFRPYAPGVEDYDLWLQLAISGVRWTPIDHALAIYRIRPGSMSKNFRAMLEGHAQVLTNALGSSAFGGTALRAVSPLALTNSLRSTALTYATMAALADLDQTTDTAAHLFAPYARPELLDPRALATTAASAIPFALGIDPSPKHPNADTWLPRLFAWWTRCATERWASQDCVKLALPHLARTLVHPRDVTNAILNALPPATSHIVVLGLDRHARRLIRAASARHLRVTAVDPTLDTLPQTTLEPLESVHASRDPAPALEAASAGAPVILVDSAPDPAHPYPLELLAARLGASPSRTLRWSDHRDHLAALNQRAIHTLLSTRSPVLARA